MDAVSASHAKQNFGDLIARARLGPVLIQRHGRAVAVMAPGDWQERLQRLDEGDARRQARVTQQQLELRRLMLHQQLGIALLSDPRFARRALKAAWAEVMRWEQGTLCSPDYIQRWREWLALPVQQLVPTMCSAADGWGVAMRQNSPFSAQVIPAMLRDESVASAG